MPITNSITSSGASTTTANLTMPFKVCMMSFGAYQYTEIEFKAIYSEGLKYLFKQTSSSFNSTIYYDEETKFYYCNSRYYSPELCRFISPDDIEYLDPESINGLNLYAYCMNDPVMCR